MWTALCWQRKVRLQLPCKKIYERLRDFFTYLSENKNFVITFTRIIFFAFFWLKLNLLLSLPKVTHKREELRSYKGFWKKNRKKLGIFVRSPFSSGNSASQSKISLWRHSSTARNSNLCLVISQNILHNIQLRIDSKGSKFQKGTILSKYIKLKKYDLPHRELNPGLSGESRVS